ncbi:MAG: prolipoprotein diacylglyceryl transferase [Bacilli bacterium]|nr:prolipoprotein diacylglyceryl transferase [Bacilli bacterium]MDD4644298.1 prolipoprotein diacylglyceryl transferase [Bacilli bacterium]
MNPYLVDFGVFQISWYSIFILFGLFIGGTLLLKEGKKFKIDEEFLSNLIFWTVIFAIIGSRLYFVAFHWDYYSLNLLDIVKFWEGGLAIHGAIIFGFIFILLYTAKYKVKLSRILDITVPGLIVGQALGRWGNFFNQEAFGSEVSRAFLEKLFIPKFIIDGMYINGTYYHPTFLYESLWCLIGFVVLMVIRKFYKYLKSGQLTGIYLMWYSFGRFFIEALRTDSLMLGNYKVAQIVSIILFVIGLILVAVKSQGSRFENLYKEEDQTDVIKF